MFKKILAVTGCMVMLSMAITSQASANPPDRFEDSNTFPADNPCTGLQHDVTINVSVAIHEHARNFVVHVRRSGSTSDGYTMVNGTESFSANANGAAGHFVDIWRSGDGSMFRASGNFVANDNQGEIKVDRFVLTCIRN